eukprot:195040-Hanusia_phi.AAC.2
MAYVKRAFMNLSCLPCYCPHTPYGLHTLNTPALHAHCQKLHLAGPGAYLLPMPCREYLLRGSIPSNFLEEDLFHAKSGHPNSKRRSSDTPGDGEKKSFHSQRFDYFI